MASVSNGKRHVINVNKLAKMFALSAWTQIAVFISMEAMRLLPSELTVITQLYQNFPVSAQAAQTRARL